MGIPEEEREEGTEEIFEVISNKSFLKVMTDTKLQIQEGQRISSRTNTKKLTPRHIIFKLQKIKDKETIFKEARGG